MFRVSSDDLLGFTPHLVIGGPHEHLPLEGCRGVRAYGRRDRLKVVESLLGPFRAALLLASRAPLPRSRAVSARLQTAFSGSPLFDRRGILAGRLGSAAAVAFWPPPGLFGLGRRGDLLAVGLPAAVASSLLLAAFAAS